MRAPESPSPSWSTLETVVPAPATPPPPYRLESPYPASPPPPITVFDVCDIDVNVPFSTLEVFPPSALDASLFSGYGGLPEDTWPHVVDLPPFYGLCTNFQFAAGQVVALSGTVTAEQEATLHEMLQMFSDILSLSYQTGAGVVAVSLAYINSMDVVWSNRYETL